MNQNQGNYDTLARTGGVVSVEIKWNCNLDLDFHKYCLPKYNFRILDDSAWNFRHGKYHEEKRRTLIKSYGLKFLINVSGSARKFDLTKTIVILVTGLGIMGLANILCDLVLLHCYHDFKEDVIKKKYEAINPKLGEKLLAENLVKLLQKEDKPGEAIKTLTTISSIVLVHTEKDWMTPSEDIQRNNCM